MLFCVLIMLKIKNIYINNRKKYINLVEKNIFEVKVNFL